MRYDPLTFTHELHAREGVLVAVFHVRGDPRDGMVDEFRSSLSNVILEHGIKRVELEFEDADDVGAELYRVCLETSIELRRQGGSLWWNWSRSRLEMVPEEVRHIFGLRGSGGDDGLTGVAANLRPPPSFGTGRSARELPEDERS